MDTWSDLWDALPADDNLYSLTNIPPAKADATVNIFSLPIELLRTIIELCNNRSILALMRVNRALHLVALWKFYANVHIQTSSHDKILSLIDNELPINEVIPNLFKKQFGVLGGVLRRPEHMATIHQLHIVDVPQSKKAEITFHRIIRYILDNAVSLRSLIIPKYNSASSTLYDGWVAPSSLRHIETPTIKTSLMTVLLGTARLTSLRITSQCMTFKHLRTLGERIGSGLQELECVIHVSAEDWGSSHENIDEFATKFPRLNNLEYGYCGPIGVVRPYGRPSTRADQCRPQGLSTHCLPRLNRRGKDHPGIIPGK
ncbi:12624_t:CDS:2 [Acaulospora colombiana]|uniref:12624_t:CDS:1 n=1 Tax=Acaulospora colombiana TaxID=27376 RepID=A0ACA9PMW3_9GLOM|nr:12624_t:CDS:2 [Acaulospora colombiana]